MPSHNGPAPTSDILSTAPLTRQELDRFERLGFLVLPGFLPEDLAARLRPEVDRWVDEGLRARSIASSKDFDTYGVPPVVELDLPAHGELVVQPRLLAVVHALMGTDFVFHHLHSDRQPPDVRGKEWHHDYEQGAETDRTRLMIHTLHYLNGLSPGDASLVILPGSHREEADKAARAHLGTGELPGELVIDLLPPRSTVVLHSALFHARRAGGRPTGEQRYFVDSSYCQVGTLWPPVKPYWRHVLGRARARGLAADRWPELFAERHFSEYVPPKRAGRPS